MGIDVSEEAAASIFTLWFDNLTMDKARCFETTVTSYRTTRRHVPWHSNLDTHHHENFKSIIWQSERPQEADLGTAQRQIKFFLSWQRGEEVCIKTAGEFKLFGKLNPTYQFNHLYLKHASQRPIACGVRRLIICHSNRHDLYHQ